jgi:transcriptional regulator with XRE-family HTH domain
MKIGKRIKAARRANRISQSELARQLGVSPQSVQQWESGETTPRRHRVAEIVRVLGCDEVWILTGQPQASCPKAPASTGAQRRTAPKPSSDRFAPLDAGIIEEILDIIEDHRLDLGHPLPTNHHLALVIAETYGAIAQEKQDRYRARIAAIIETSFRQVEGDTAGESSARQAHETSRE